METAKRKWLLRSSALAVSLCALLLTLIKRSGFFLSTGNSLQVAFGHKQTQRDQFDMLTQQYKKNIRGKQEPHEKQYVLSELSSHPTSESAKNEAKNNSYTIHSTMNHQKPDASNIQTENTTNSSFTEAKNITSSQSNEENINDNYFDDDFVDEHSSDEDDDIEYVYEGPYAKIFTTPSPGNPLEQFKNELERESQIVQNVDNNGQTVQHPKFVVILKSPRSGSTFLSSALEEDPRIDLQFEPDLMTAMHHFSECSRKETPHEDGNHACVVSLNGFLDEDRYDQIMELINHFNASVFIQLRANVVEKALSAEKAFDREDYLSNEEFARRVREGALRSKDTIRAFVNADKFFSVPPKWIWYEDLIRNCEKKIEEFYQEIDLPIFTPEACLQAKFNEDAFPDYLMQEIMKEPALVPMIDHLSFDMEIDTQEIYEEFATETANISEILMPFWR